MRATSLALAAASLVAAFAPAARAQQRAAPGRAWWKEAVVYEVYPRSFQDTNGDGVGDLKGVIQHLDYIKSLGVDVVWLTPIYGSPNADNGYDVSDYRAIMAQMGTMADFDALLQGMHARGLKLVMDLVVNHSSDEHPWFQQSRQSRTNPYRDYYHWWPAEKGTPPRRVSFFDVAGDAWRFDSTTNAYYLHYFSRKQPDLNWENPTVRREVYDLMKFWLDKGVDGFRMDVIPFIAKDTTFPPLPRSFFAYYANGPHLHDYLHEMNREVLSRYDVMTVGEGAGVEIQDALKFVDPARQELQTFYHFDVQGWGRTRDQAAPDSANRRLADLKAIFTRWDSVFADRGWGTVYWGTHDQARAVSRFGNDAPAYRVPSAKMLHTLLLTMRATPYVYNGDEIGMTNVRFTRIEDYRDIETRTRYQRLQGAGASDDALRAFLRGQAEVARENGRTPMQWTAGAGAGFTTGTPWLTVNPNASTINVAAAERDTGSVLHYFRRLVALRRAEPTLVYGRYQLLDRDNPDVFSYTRTLNGRTLLVALSFSTAGGRTAVPAGYAVGRMLSNNLAGSPVQGAALVLQPYQAVVLELRKD